MFSILRVGQRPKEANPEGKRRGRFRLCPSESNISAISRDVTKEKRRESRIKESANLMAGGVVGVEGDEERLTMVKGRWEGGKYIRENLKRNFPRNLSRKFSGERGRNN